MIDLVIYGKPIGKARPRFGRNKGTGKVVTFTPQKTKHYEQEIATTAQCAMFGKELMEGPVKVEIRAFFFHAKKTGSHVSRPDIDNIVKAILDGLNGVAFKDDAAVAMLLASKQYVNDEAQERVEVVVDNV
jgi:Holliday junction resolvase RusA-like endonuclease